MIPQGARLADLAKAAGVSTATVSRVLNDKPGVAESTRQAVLSAIESLGYQVEDHRGADDGFIAVMVPELANPGFAAFATEPAADRSADNCAGNGAHAAEPSSYQGAPLGS